MWKNAEDSITFNKILNFYFRFTFSNNSFVEFYLNWSSNKFGRQDKVNNNNVTL